MQRHERFSDLSKDFSKLLVGIPGPERTPWSGLYPVLFHWKNGYEKPPWCKLPGGFHHTNIYPSGTVCLSSLNEEEDWRPDFTIPEMLFDIQQLLAHPNYFSPSQREAWQCYTKNRAEYDRIATEHAQKYRPDKFLENAKKIPWISDSEWVLVEDSAQEPREPPVEPPVAEEKKGPMREKLCKCSCCAWGTATGLWDRLLQMRFIWGIGG